MRSNACSRRCRGLSALLFIALGSGPAAAGLLTEEAEITNGTFEAFHIGMSSKEALSALDSAPGGFITVIPALDFQLSALDLEALSDLDSSDGVSVSNSRGVQIDLLFRAGRIKAIDKSPPARANAWFTPGESIEDVKSTLVEELRADRSLVGFPIVDPTTRLGRRIDDLTDAERDLLGVQKRWKIEDASVKLAGATLVLTFQDQRLVKLSYRRDRIDWK